MACQSGFDGDFCGFAVTDFTDHHDVGVGTQNRTKCRGKGHTCAVVHLHLIDARHTALNGVFQRNDVLFERADFRQGCIQGGGFTATGRPCNQHEAVGHMNGLVKARELPFREMNVFNGNIPLVAL